MLYLYNNNKLIKPIIERNAMHKDALDQIDNREEPLVSVAKLDESTTAKAMSQLVDDPTTDPEGAARRSEGNAEAFPPFILADYKLSLTTFWGKAWPDKQEHLIPKQSLVASVMQVAKLSENNYGGMLALATGSSNKANYELIKQGFEFMMLGLDREYIFPLMRQLGNLTNQALAERAFQKYMYMQAASRQDDNKPEPEWMLNLKDRMMKASAMAGTYVTTHGECWKIAQFNGVPKYMLDNEIKLRLVNNARYLENNFGDKPQPLPTVADHLAVALDC